MAMPLIKPTIRKIRFPDELTAASALLPRKFSYDQGISSIIQLLEQISQKQWNCKKMIFWEILPSVILRLFFIVKITLPFPVFFESIEMRDCSS